MNNIFEFAPKELVLDAFLCWCFNFDKSENILEKEFSHNLVKEIYALCGGKKKLNIKAINPLRQQTESKIDVVIDITLHNDEKLTFIFENKLETSYHSNQLEEHVNNATREFNGEKKYIYFKIGHMYQEDLMLPEDVRDQYTTIDRMCILNIFKVNQLDNDIFKSYYKFLLKIEESYKVEKELLQKGRQLKQSELETLFCSPSGQYMILDELNQKLGGKIKLSKGTSFGRPWSNISLIRIKEKHSVFWRIDWRKNNKDYKPYICLRKYKTTMETTKEDDDFLQGMRMSFEKITKEYSSLEFSNIHNLGSKEREIGILFFDNEKNTIPNVINELASFTRSFIIEINKEEQFYEKIPEL